jgi:hypothetical protein
MDITKVAAVAAVTTAVVAVIRCRAVAAVLATLRFSLVVRQLQGRTLSQVSTCTTLQPQLHQPHHVQQMWVLVDKQRRSHSPKQVMAALFFDMDQPSRRSTS